MNPLWITYAWKDDDEGDFRYLAQELRAVGVEAMYDKIALIPGRRLWEQLADKITNSPLCGWAYLLAPNSLTSEPCREELAYALDRTLRTKGGDFPLVGLLHAVRIEDVPPALRVRVCVSLANPDWKEELAAAVEGRSPSREWRPQTTHIWNVHSNYLGNPTHTAVEVRPRFGQMMYWRFIVPASASVVQWGFGPAGGAATSGTMVLAIEGTVHLRGTPCVFFGCGDALSPSTSAYAVFQGELPEFIGFGGAQEPSGLPTDMEMMQPARLQP
jgi:hypothetical protein